MQPSFDNRIVSYINFEERSLYGLLRHFKSSHFNSANIFYEVQKANSFDSQLISELIKTSGITGKSISFVPDNSLQMVNSIREIIADLDYRRTNLVLDISTAPIDFTFHAIQYLYSHLGKFYYVHNEPCFYGEKPLMREYRLPESVIGFAGSNEDNKKQCSIIITGFDSDFTSFLIEHYESDKILLGIQRTRKFDNHRRNVTPHRKLIKHYSHIETFELDSFAYDHGFEAIDLQIQKHKNDYNISITNLGPKPTVMAIYKAWQEHQTICINKSIAKKHSSRFSVGIGKQTKRMFDSLNTTTIQYDWISSSNITPKILNECSQLFSANYGIWSDKARLPSRPITLSAGALKMYLENGKNWIATARKNDQLIAYAFCKRIATDRGMISWITQLVVHEEYRNQGVATQILNSIWGFSNHYAWGLATSSPYAVRALEKATRRLVTPEIVLNNLDGISPMIEAVFYLKDSKTIVSTEQTRVKSEFYVDRTALKDRINKASKGRQWMLGELEEGDEWLAVVFKDQKQIPCDETYIRQLFMRSDDVNLEAYSRMANDSEHVWMSKTKEEVDFIIDTFELGKDDEVLDFGCGNGRHTEEFARRGYKVTCVDVLKQNIDRINKIIEQNKNKNNFGRISPILSDCRYLSLPRRFSYAICLYDVIGSFPHPLDNNYLLDSLASLLYPDGKIILSMMNQNLSAKLAINKADVYENPDILFELKPSNIMASTGNVFDPNYFIFDEKNGIFYRKEQFDNNDGLPRELIVRDRRYTDETIRQLCKNNHLSVDWARYVKLGDWTHSLGSEDVNAKELLVLCTKE